MTCVWILFLLNILSLILYICCRDLAIQQKVSWTEYWEFLESFVNLRESHGLEKLEKFLEECGSTFITGYVRGENNGRMYLVRRTCIRK